MATEFYPNHPMKNFLLPVLAVLAMVTFAFQQTQVPSDFCNSVESKQKCKDALKPGFQYDATKVTKVSFTTKKDFKELEVPLYIGEKYRFVFNSEGNPQPVDIEVYDNKFESKKRKLLFSSRDFPAEQKQFVFEPDRAKRVFIDYTIPPTTDSTKKGCVVFAIGYKIGK